MEGTRIAIWSGPRNISTALLRSWGSREDTFVCDEPLYAHYLDATGIAHPGREEVLASQDRDWRSVVRWLTGPIPEGKRIFYQKHMAHHLLPGMDREWIHSLTNALLIRHPAEMLPSLLKVYPGAGLPDTGLPQQVELFDRLAQASGMAPPVLDARDVLENPGPQLAALCERLGVPFSPAMLAWDPGPRPTDGVWAKHWYAAVERSTGFERHQPERDNLPAEHQALLASCLPLYETLRAHRLLARV